MTTSNPTADPAMDSGVPAPTSTSKPGGLQLAPLTPARAISEPWAFALLQWPPLLALLAWDLEGALGWVLRVALGLLLALSLLGAYSGQRGIGFGNAMACAAACVAGIHWAWPGAWAVGGLVLLALLMLTAQQLRLRAAASALQ